MASSLSGLSASVTRILSLTGFPKELKTKDIQSAFSEYDSMPGGFKIKWRDDTSLLIVFGDATVAKRAYLHTLAFPPPILTSSTTGVSATIKPYDGPDAQSVIQTVNARSHHNPSASRSHHPRAQSVSVFPTARTNSGSNAHPNSNGRNHHASPSGQHVVIPEGGSSSAREPSPTLPSIPSHPTLNSLINSTLGDNVIPADPAIVATSAQQPQAEATSGPRIGDPGKRMLGAALGVRHPGLPPRVINNSGTNPSQTNGVDQAMRELPRAMGGLVVAE